MSIGKTAASGAAMAFALWSAPASAQDAAESAVILGGTGEATGRASRDMGTAVRGGIDRASGALQATRSGRARAGRYDGADSGTSTTTVRGSAEGYRIPAGVDALELTDAPRFQLGNGSTIRVSGAFIPSDETFCISYCFAEIP